MNDWKVNSWYRGDIVIKEIRDQTHSIIEKSGWSPIRRSLGPAIGAPVWDSIRNGVWISVLEDIDG